VRRAVLIHNPVAGTRKRSTLLGNLKTILRDGGVEVELAPTSGPGAATEIARDVAASGSADTVLALGGDGTAREAAKGLLGTEVALAPLPGGTTNVVTRALGLPINPEKAAKALLGARRMESDVGLCNDEPFLIVASLGVDAAMMAEASTRLKNLAGRAGVVATGLRTWWTYDYPQIPYSADGEASSATLFAVCNIAHYAGDFQLAPGASFNDHRLHLVAFTGAGRAATANFVFQLTLGRHLDMSEIEIRPVTEATVPAPLTAPFELDGDPIETEGPLTIKLAQQRITLLTNQP
jgi:diacylglycerol kinase (ATP)